MTTTLENVVAALKAAGYKVNLTPQEKMGVKEIVITLDSIDLEVETALSYFMTSTYVINFQNESIVEIATEVPAIVNIIDKAAVGTMRDFKAITPSVAKLDGTLYLIGLKFSFKEMINIV